MPIRARLALLFAFGAAVLIAVGGLVFVAELSRSLRSSLSATLQAQAEAIARAVPPPVGGESQAEADSGGDGAVGPPSLPRLPHVPSPAALASLAEIGQILGANSVPVRTVGVSPETSLLSAAQLAKARRGDLLIERRPPGAPARDLLLAKPVPGWPGVVVVVGASLATVDDAIGRVETALVVGGSAGVLLAGFGAWILAGAALAPVSRMRRQAAALSEGDEAATLVVPATRDEIAALAKTLNALLTRLQAALSRQRGFVAAAGHELRTPLSVLRGELELAGRPGRSREDLVAAVREAATETDRLIRLAEDLLLLARSDGQQPLAVLAVQEIAGVVNCCAEAFARAAVQHGVTLNVEVPPGLRAALDDIRFRQVMDNLVANALRFAPRGSTIRLTARAERNEVVVEVLDQGPGFPAEFIPRAFERFSRADDSRDRGHGGAGLGLAIVKVLVDAHHGQVRLENRPEGGARVQVALPVPGQITPPWR